MTPTSHYCPHCDAYRRTPCNPWSHWHTPDADGNCIVCGISDN